MTEGVGKALRLSEFVAVTDNQALKHIAAVGAADALALNASAIIFFLFVGYDDELEAQNVASCALFVREASRLGLPCIVEVIAFGGLVTGVNQTEILTRAARMAVEIGADMLKVPYTGDPLTFRKLVDEAGVPVLVLGGARSREERDALELVEEALSAGAAGILVGRNVTKSPDPTAAVRRLRRLVHGRESVGQILHGEGGQRWHLVTDATRCTGCQLCLLNCHAWHEGEFGTALARLRLETNVPVVCDLCGTCIQVCPVEALSLHPATRSPPARPRGLHRLPGLRRSLPPAGGRLRGQLPCAV